ncbi:hypothetical protein PD653_0635 [Nocardioides sp. PD653]|nr:hypothetical protein PD653B2_1401 [Nocardioides sp. PD653-B2]GAW53237.1 hypothetical protein PD653_0635 [Nocardioides sp. PD653]
MGRNLFQNQSGCNNRLNPPPYDARMLPEPTAHVRFRLERQVFKNGGDARVFGAAL